MKHLLPKFYFVPARYVIVMRQVTFQCQLKGGVFMEVNDVEPRIFKNTFTALDSQLKPHSERRIYALNLQGNVSHFKVSTEPELAITGPRDAFSKPLPSRFNPLLIIEVLLPNDKSAPKFQRYRQITTLREYVRIDPKHYLVEHLVRQSEQEWKKSQLENWVDRLDLGSIDCHLSLTEIYDKVELLK
mgnify:CR=1 FL=1